MLPQNPSPRLEIEASEPASVPFTVIGDMVAVEGGYPCARCGRSHDPFVLKEFKGTLPRIGGIRVTHWAMCPTLHEPVLARLTDTLPDEQP